MGMDVIGKSGNYFRNNWWYWRPLAEYCFLVAPEVLRTSNHCSEWTFNSGSMTATEATTLSTILQYHINSGQTAGYAEERLETINSMANVPCRICHGTGKRHEKIDPSGWVMPGTIVDEAWTCNVCQGEGTCRPTETMYYFSVENVQEFANFLFHSDGFELT